MKNPGIEKEMREQKQAETALKLSEGHFQQMFEKMLNGVAYYKIEVDKDNNPVDYTVLDVNNAFEKCSGLRKKDIIGKKVTKVLTGIEKDPAVWIEKYGQVALSGKELCFEQYSQNLNKWFNITAYSPQRDYFVAIWEDITARKQAEAELKDSEERLKILFEYAPDAYYLNDLKGYFVDGNKEAQRITGYSREELIRKSFLKLGLLPLAQGPKALKLLAKNALGQPTGPDDFCLIHKNGSRVSVEIRTYPVKIKNKTFVLGIARDVSQAKQAEEALKAQKRFLEILIDTIPNPIFYKDLKGQYTGCNKAFEEAMESAKEEIIGRTVFDIAPKDIADTHYEKDKELFQNPGRQMHTGQIRQESGEIREVILNKATFLDSKGKVAGLIGVISDITALKLAENKLEEYNHQLKEMVRERTKELEDAQEQLILKERLSALGQLAGSVGHDLRTPLGAIKNSTYYLNMALKDPEPEIKETIEIINKEISISEGIINELLDFARSKSTTKNMVNLNEALEAAISRVQIPSEISVEKQFQNDLPAILADSIQLGQIFTNILLNAVQAMPKGGRIIIRSAHEGESSVLISISDTGTGIPEENRSKLFEPLFTTKAKGIGLGLAMVKNLVEQHGGMIQAESRKGEGSTFTISFPVLTTEQST